MDKRYVWAILGWAGMVMDGISGARKKPSGKQVGRTTEEIEAERQEKRAAREERKRLKAEKARRKRERRSK
jgi:hypothetical protein